MVRVIASVAKVSNVSHWPLSFSFFKSSCSEKNKRLPKVMKIHVHSNAQLIWVLYFCKKI